MQRVEDQSRILRLYSSRELANEAEVTGVYLHNICKHYDSMNTRV